MHYYQSMEEEYARVGDDEQAEMCRETAMWLSMLIQYCMFDETMGGVTTQAQATYWLYTTLLQVSDEGIKNLESGKVYKYYLEQEIVTPDTKYSWESGYDNGFLDAIANIGGSGYIEFLEKLANKGKNLSKNKKNKKDEESKEG